ncbi:hypothetical protein [Kitasatospora cinereorecta]|uniref:Lipoprotein n=1 Tax=Kitasatospora cinereorecta TaxID=285560 RepID=A0ABW0VMN0_9ACTN
MMPTRRLVAGAAVLLIAATGTACGHRTTGRAAAPAASASLPASASAPASTTSNDALGADDLAARAKYAMGRLSSVTVDGTIHVDQEEMTIHLTADRDKNCQGTVALGSIGEVEVRHTGSHTWIKPDARFWTSIAAEQGAGSSGQAVAEVFKGRYLTGGEDDANLKEVSEMCGLIEGITDGDLAPDAVKAGTGTVNGTRTVNLQTTDGDGTHSTLYIAAEGEPYVVRMESPEQGRVDFSAFDVPFTVQAPPADAVIDYTAFQQKAKTV